MASANKVYYGSGTVFATKYDEDTFPTSDTDIAETVAYIKTMATDDNIIGYLKDGYQLTVETENFEDESDLGEMKVSDITKETATINFKLFNANAETIATMYPSAKITTDDDGYNMMVAGGLSNMNNQLYAILFKHDDAEYGQTVVLAIAKNVNGFSLNFKQGSVEPFAMEWSVQPYLTTGRFVKILDVPVGEDIAAADAE